MSMHDHGPRRRLLQGLLVLLCLAVTAPASAREPAPERVVSIGGAVTELVYELGAEERLVAVDSTSLYPPDALERLPDVGYLRSLSAEPILALDPDLVLALEDAGPPEALAQLRDAGVRIETIPNTPTPAGVAEKTRAVGTALELEQEAERLAQRLEAELNTLETTLAEAESRPRVLFLLSIGRGAPMAGGRGTAADGIISLAGGANAVTAFEGFKPLSPEAALEAAPDVVLVTKSTLDALGGREALLARPELAGTPAGAEQRLVVMNSLLLLGFGVRPP
ncbi:heme/hemin ABC transporter substrate-binding protein, partial [Fodinicurvata halophila]|uniref:heme/hemin ABC transporter substrate-binding protein n=1 Tax=Fodinicurvata halophila TaxID=1419723 RepID=UPI003610A09F